jgi:hypothetical protein
MSKLNEIKPKISIAHPLDDALVYIEQIVRYKEDWPLDRIIAIKKVMNELDKVMGEITNNTVNPNILDGKEEE